MLYKLSDCTANVMINMIKKKIFDKFFVLIFKNMSEKVNLQYSVSRDNKDLDLVPRLCRVAAPQKRKSHYSEPSKWSN